MPSRETKERILDQSELLFGEHGFAGTSLRTITSEAGVDLGSVRYHFGSKATLFESVLRRRLEPLCLERRRGLEELQTRDTPPNIEELLTAFVEPALKIVCHPTYGSAWRNLIARARAEPTEYLSTLTGLIKDNLRSYLEAFVKALPDLPRDEVTHRFFFAFGAEVNTLIDRQTLRLLDEDTDNLVDHPHRVLPRLVHFLAAGLRAPSHVPDVSKEISR